jgi:hypothetical protein
LLKTMFIGRVRFRTILSCTIWEHFSVVTIFFSLSCVKMEIVGIITK